ncbi:hypothetical protein HELRODRAFT_157076 [Helobdella robusta]|uniref:Uncharacterized protein n=1 Tax=Helobdella robusta TaxID=6412 RepID=T1EM59_HELRO|nr:hypothetical protein HELRODRAFT_157076 [Helobdella robusta]ESO03679.1 hypothetical protein HELRODRAFT_157076 [Helobdella robusta]
MTFIESGTHVWKGYLLAVLFFVMTILDSLLLQQVFHIGMNAGMRMKGCIIALVYKKALTMSSQSRKRTTVGEITNLISVDSQRLQDSIEYSYALWSSPLQICLCLYLLYGILGVSVFVGIGILVLFVPINWWVTSKQGSVEVTQMGIKDERIKLMNEILNGIKVIKLYAWELSFQEKVNVIRNLELKTLKKYYYYVAVSIFSWSCAPALVRWSHAFTALSLFNILKEPMFMFPTMMSYIVMGFVSLRRIEKFLQCADVNPNNVIELEEDKDDDKDINLKVKKKSLTAIVGQVGIGKSSLLSAMLGDMEKKGGLVTVKGRIGYVSQQAWIENATLKANILFGKEFDEERYNKVIEACALRQDLEILPGGDMTEIGERGINLSGGQKQRVSMARSIYQDCDVYLLDDPLSAVDAHVARHIFTNVIGPRGMLRDKTRVLVTHGIAWLPSCDVVVVMAAGGLISECGSYRDLLSHNLVFAKFIRDFLQKHENDDDEEDEEEDGALRKSTDGMNEKLVKQFHHRRHHHDHHHHFHHLKYFRRKSESSADGVLVVERKVERIIQEEVAETGQVKWPVYWTYIRALGKRFIIFLIIFIAARTLPLLTNVWLSMWTSDPIIKNVTIFTNQSDVYKDREMVYLWGYTALGLGQAVLILMYAMLSAVVNARAARVLHDGLLKNILRWFTHSFIADDIFRHHPHWENYKQIFQGRYRCKSRFYIPTNRQLKRLESTTLSPIYVHLSESIAGTSIIRAFKKQEDFIEKCYRLVDHNLQMYFANITSNRWLNLLLDCMGGVVVLSAAIFAVMDRDVLSSAFVGLSVSSALSMTVTLSWFIEMGSELESAIVSVERVKEYSETPTEADWSKGSFDLPLTWPSKHDIIFHDYGLRYRSGLELVLKNINLDIKAKEKIGIVGRTGAGKSSLTLALFRLIEPSEGCIRIDGVDISSIGLHQLRSKLTILPQDPVIFSGSLRFNLDPTNHHTDEQIWTALDHAHLKTFVASLSGTLDNECGEGGSNLSVGQRQLLCLGRALLHKTGVLVLDEATAAVDLETDKIIQETIRTQFDDCTVLTIAHRINTILNCDRVLVMDGGRVAEFDSPESLLDNKQSLFYALAKDANVVS